jgi:hypothetical protein
MAKVLYTEGLGGLAAEWHTDRFVVGRALPRRLQMRWFKFSRGRSGAKLQNWAARSRVSKHIPGCFSTMNGVSSLPLQLDPIAGTVVRTKLGGTIRTQLASCCAKRMVLITQQFLPPLIISSYNVMGVS